MTRFILTFLMLVPLCACIMGPIDYGYKMQPIGSEDEIYLYRKYNGFELFAGIIGGLDGEWSIYPNMMISTDNEAITITSVELKTSNGNYEATIPDKFKLIPAHTKNMKFYLHWDFGKDTTAPRVMGEKSTMIFHIKVGENDTFAVIAYEKAECC